MSYILQALKRAEADRREAAVAAGPTRSPAAPAGRPHGPPPPHPLPPGALTRPEAAATGGTLHLWLVGGGLGLVVNALVFGSVLVATRPSSVPVVAPPAAAVEKTEEPPVQAPPAPPPSKQVVTGRSPAAPAKSSPAERLEDAARARTGTGPGHRRARDRDTVDPEPRPPGAPAAAAPTTLAMAPPVVPTYPTFPGPAQPSRPAAEIAPEQPSEAPAPPLGRRRRRASLREPAPAVVSPEQPGAVESEPDTGDSRLKIDVLVWAADPERRMVYLNGRKYVEGDVLANGVVVEGIREDGVVLVYRDQRFMLPSEAR